MAIETLAERLERRISEYNKFVKAEILTQEILDKLPANIVPSYLFVHDSFTNIKFNASTFEEAEIDIIPVLSDLLDQKWDRTVYEERVEYTLDKQKSGHMIYVYVTVRTSEYCTVEKVPNGRKVRQTEYIEVDEYDYVINCSEEAD